MVFEITGSNAYGLDAVGIKMISVHAAAAAGEGYLYAHFLQCLGSNLRNIGILVNFKGAVEYIRSVFDFYAVLFFDLSYRCSEFFQDSIKFRIVGAACFC